MPSIKDLKKRITSVKNTQQTTRAMKMVSAAKLRRAQEAITSQRPYSRNLSALIKKVGQIDPEVSDSPLFKGFQEGEWAGKKKLLLLLFTSDRGLCGGFNGNIIKTAQRWVTANKGNYEQLDLGFVGSKGFDFFKTKNYSRGTYFKEAGGKVTFLKAKGLANQVVDEYLAGKYTEVKFIYNEFKNAVVQKVQVEDFLPIVPSDSASVLTPKAEPLGSVESKGIFSSDIYLVKPSTKEVFEQLLRKNFSVQVFRVLLESQASEHGSRMSAMENATRNGGEMIKKLTLVYNKQRQAGITKELLEIISGSESQKVNG